MPYVITCVFLYALFCTSPRLLNKTWKPTVLTLKWHLASTGLRGLVTSALGTVFSRQNPPCLPSRTPFFLLLTAPTSFKDHSLECEPTMQQLRARRCWASGQNRFPAASSHFTVHRAQSQESYLNRILLLTHLKHMVKAIMPSGLFPIRIFLSCYLVPGIYFCLSGIT